MGIERFMARCRAMWQEAGLELTEQQRFDLAEALAGMVYPEYRSANSQECI
jgi:hypothetical protein